MISCTPSGGVRFEPSNQPSVCIHCSEYWQDHYRIEDRPNISGGDCAPNACLKYKPSLKHCGACTDCGRYKNEHFNKSNKVLKK